MRAQYRTTLDEGDEIGLLPDITWWRDGRCRAVVDAKYKRVSNASYPNADAYQMLAYCTRLGLDEGWLIYADLDGGRTASQVIRNAGVTIRVESIDLGGPIERLEASGRERWPGSSRSIGRVRRSSGPGVDLEDDVTCLFVEFARYVTFVHGQGYRSVCAAAVRARVFAAKARCSCSWNRFLQGQRWAREAPAESRPSIPPEDLR